MTPFWLFREEDANNVSGVGIVAEGVIFSNGQAVLRWLGAKTSIAMYVSIEAVEEIHGHGGKTLVIYGEPCLLSPNGISCVTPPDS